MVATDVNHRHSFKVFCRHVKTNKDSSSEVNSNNIFYLAKYIKNTNIPTCNQHKEMINEIFYLCFPAKFLESSGFYT